jgi:hypothetical protein
MQPCIDTSVTVDPTPHSLAHTVFEWAGPSGCSRGRVVGIRFESSIIATRLD